MQTRTKPMSNVATLTINAIIAALYVVLSLITPLAAGPVQLRISESLNHLVVFNRKLLWGVFAGCVMYNALFGMGIMDVLFGGGQTLLALTLTAVLQHKVKNAKVRLVLNSLFFTASMFLIAIMLHIVSDVPFWPTYGTLALSEFAVMVITAPIMYYLNQKLDFANRL
ncbi:QueT transporter family protein [Enterococcus sp. 2201sp1_2201st1_B8_2201SCRN_220225]|uniref:QueT transporter family protein n=1 Tax=unclassified Enterococcus TaxID=2608891 RepID=UPI0034A34D55